MIILAHATIYIIYMHIIPDAVVAVLGDDVERLYEDMRPDYHMAIDGGIVAPW